MRPPSFPAPVPATGEGMLRGFGAHSGTLHRVNGYTAMQLVNWMNFLKTQFLIFTISI
jgi:hypothetical protein